MAHHPGKRPFWMHQLAEYVIGGALFANALQRSLVVPAIIGGIIALHAAATRGTFAAFRLIDRAVHRRIDPIIMVVTLLAAVQPVVSIPTASRWTLLGAAIVHAFVFWQSSFYEKPKRPPVSMEGGRHVEVGRMAGRAVGTGVSKWRNRNN